MIQKKLYVTQDSIVIKKEGIIVFLVLLAVIIRFTCIAIYKNDIFLYSDDLGYYSDAVSLIKYGRFISAHAMIVMPGTPVFMAIIFSIFGYGKLGLLAVKVAFCILGTLTVYGIYLIGKRVWGILAGLIAALFLAFSLPNILINNLMLTESLFIFITVYFVYFLLKAIDTKKHVDFYITLLFYIIGIFTRPTIALVPILFIPYFIKKKYPIKRLLVQVGLVCVAVLILLIPWWIRNYSITGGNFVSFTGGSGAQMLKGSYQGSHVFDGKNTNEFRAIQKKLLEENEYENDYFLYQDMGELAEERIKHWWGTAKKSFIVNYTIDKPYLLLYDYFYSIPIFGVDYNTVGWFHRAMIWLGGMSILFAIIFAKGKRLAVWTVIAIPIYYIVIHIPNVVMGRYFMPAMPFWYLAIGVAVSILFNKLPKKRKHTSETLNKEKVEG